MSTTDSAPLDTPAATTAQDGGTPDGLHLLAGRLVGRPDSDSTDPATGDVIGRFADGSAAEAQAAVDAARSTFDTTTWPRDRAVRAAALFQLADLLHERRQQFIDLLALENGKTLAEAAFEVDLSVPKLRYFGALALTDTARAAEVAPGTYSESQREAAGVAAVIVPWNSPVVLSVRSFAPALAAGCTVAMKLPAQTGLVNGLLHRLFADADLLPAGVVNSFTESGADGARLLVASPDVDVVSYTGSTAVGRQIAASAAMTLKGVGLELGGKTPMIVFDDADLDLAVPVLTAAVTTFGGQFCMTGSRILVQRGIADALRARLAASFEAVRVGPGSDPDSDMGAVIDHANVDRIDRAVEEALAYATPVVRGGRPPEPALRAGAYYRPALLEVTDTATPLVQQEVFGPVATFEVFDTEQDAITRANATEFGLAASVWSRDVDRPRRVGRELRVGTVWTNTWAVVTDQFEEGGAKQSGVGRLNGVGGLEAFQETKHYVHVAPPA